MKKIIAYAALVLAVVVLITAASWALTAPPRAKKATVSTCTSVEGATQTYFSAQQIPVTPLSATQCQTAVSALALGTALVTVRECLAVSYLYKGTRAQVLQSTPIKCP